MLLPEALVTYVVQADSKALSGFMVLLQPGAMFLSVLLPETMWKPVGHCSS